MTIEKVGVLGCGLMGAGIAEVSAKAGFETWVREDDERFLTAGLGRIEKSLDRAVAKGKLDEDAKAATLGRLNGTVEEEDLAEKSDPGS